MKSKHPVGDHRLACEAFPQVFEIVPDVEHSHPASISPLTGHCRTPYQLLELVRDRIPHSDTRLEQISSFAIQKLKLKQHTIIVENLCISEASIHFRRPAP